MDKILIVDNEPDTDASLSGILKDAIEGITGAEVGAEALVDVVLADALPHVRRRIGNMVADGHHVVGILLDLVDEHDPQAGLKLLRRLKADAVLSHIAVVIYTSKYVKIDAADAKAAGANGVLRRPSTGGMAPQVLAEEALRLLGVRY